MTREWKPGDVAMVTWTDSYDGDVQRMVRILVKNGATDQPVGKREDAWWGEDGYLPATCKGLDIRPLVVIDPEDRERVERLAIAYTVIASARSGDEYRAWENRSEEARNRICVDLAAALRDFANPTPPKPTDPKARVTDRRENIWRLLADGDWVCTSGPDVGEYLKWDQLAGDRGPVTIEVDR